LSHLGVERIAKPLLGLCFLVSISCAGHLAGLVPGVGNGGGAQAAQSQSDAAYQNAQVEQQAARERARTEQAQSQARANEQKHAQAEKDRVAKLREDKRQQVLEARSRADADPKSADAVDNYTKAVLDSDTLLRKDSENSFNWTEQADHAAGLAQKAAPGAPGAQKKAHLYAQSGLLRARLDQNKEAITAFEHALKEQPGNLRVVEYLLGEYASTKAPLAESEGLCKRTSKSLKGESVYNLINVCVNLHPKRSDYSVPSDLDKLAPWVPAGELKQYKRWLGEGICKEEKMKECQSACKCDPAQVYCTCKERCKTDANACMVPYLQ
jgi:hypothetical protein